MTLSMPVLFSLVAASCCALTGASASAEEPTKEEIAKAIKDGVEGPAVLQPLRDTSRSEPISVEGCVISQTYNTQSVEEYSVQFRINGPSGPEMFNILKKNIEHVPDPSSFSLADRMDTLMWSRFIDSFERAAMTDRPVTVSYEPDTNKVFGVSIAWNKKCPTTPFTSRP